MLWQSLCFLSCPKIVFSGSGKTKKSVEFNLIFQTWKVKKFDYRSQKVWEQWREKCIYWTAIFTFFSHQFLHHWAWKHYLGPEVVKVIESYFEFYNFEFWDITLQWPFGKKCLCMEPRSKIKTFFSMPSFAWWFLLLKKHDCRNYLQSVLYVHVLHLSGFGEENKRVQTRDGHFRKVRRVAGSEHKAC